VPMWAAIVVRLGDAKAVYRQPAPRQRRPAARPRLAQVLLRIART